jgi:hypothetical protein
MAWHCHLIPGQPFPYDFEMTEKLTVSLTIWEISFTIAEPSSTITIFNCAS